MRRFALVPALALLALACQDRQLPTDGADESPSASPAVSVQPASVDAEDIEDLIRELFPEPGLERAALTQFGNVERKVEEGDLDEARAKAFDLIRFTGEKLGAGQLEDPAGGTAEEGAVELVALLLAFVGLEAPEVSPSVLSGEKDGVVALASPDQDNLIVTENEFAGTFIQAGALDEETVVVIERLDPTAQPGDDCLPVTADQREGCYRFDKAPDDPFNEDVLVAVCPEAGLRDETDPDFEQFQLAKFDPDRPGLGVVALPSAAEDFLDCSDFGTLASAGQGPLGRLAGAWSATGGRLLGWLGPAPAEAINIGFGGSTRDFSRIGWARLLEVQLTAGDEQSDFTGFPVDANPTVQVGPFHPSASNELLETQEVTFSVVGGGGTVDDPGTAGDDRLNSVTVATNSNGQASVPWRLGGDAGANELAAAAGGDTAVFTATATAPQLPIQCTGDGRDRVLNEASQSTVGRAFYVPGYPDADLARVDLWFAADNQVVVEDDPVPVADDYTIELTVRAGGFDANLLGTDQTTVELSGDPDVATQVSFFFQIGSITPGTTLAFHPVVTAGPDANVLMEVPESDADPQFGLPGDADCPIIETNDATAPLGTDRRQGVRANIFDEAPIEEGPF